MAGRYDVVVRDVQGLRGTLERQARALDDQAQEDVVIDGARRLLLRSPNGTYFALVVSDAGVISTVNMGAHPL